MTKWLKLLMSDIFHYYCISKSGVSLLSGFHLTVDGMNLSSSLLKSLFNDNHPYLKIASVLPIKDLRKWVIESSKDSDKLVESPMIVSGPTLGTYNMYTIQGELQIILNEIKFKLDIDRSFQHLYMLEKSSTKNREENVFQEPSEHTNMSFGYENSTYYCKMDMNSSIDECRQVIANVNFVFMLLLLDTTELWHLLLVSEYPYLLQFEGNCERDFEYE